MIDMVHTETDADGIIYAVGIEPEIIEVRGNTLASGDDAEDKGCEDEILERLKHGDIWAWACVSVTATFEGFTGSNELGCCSYKDTQDFIGCGEFDTMQSEARRDMFDAMMDAYKQAPKCLALMAKYGIDVTEMALWTKES